MDHKFDVSPRTLLSERNQELKPPVVYDKYNVGFIEKSFPFKRGLIVDAALAQELILNKTKRFPFIVIVAKKIPMCVLATDAATTADSSPWSQIMREHPIDAFKFLVDVSLAHQFEQQSFRLDWQFAHDQFWNAAEKKRKDR